MSSPIAANFNLLSSRDDISIKNVWNYNLYEEFHVIRQIVQKYHWVAMDTEFPGVVARPIGEFRSTADYQYQLLRSIVTREDMYAQDSIDLLQNSGLKFREHEDHGIEPLEFAELLMSSGIVLMDNIKWLSFHSGYDFGYLLKLLTDRNLPQEENDFFESLRLYFPTVYDVKYLMKLCKNLKGGLQEVADQLELRRVGPQHQAGSDSLLTGMAFFKIKEIFFDGNIESTSGHLYGLGAPFSTNANNFQENGENGS
ncbi:CCR4-NOT transcription complex subunit 7-like isoform X3 [Pieris brassicae]|uniref:CCR4-NOT transcription complex subunit 7-like isoform X3 n=1 Tax=Pieris brassicae TaxID=7116 RepID=UPI001E660938|nr:CCR4-NOT transcription complex subunit 7-like isoform X3 [Pieris brassicae]